MTKKRPGSDADDAPSEHEDADTEASDSSTDGKITPAEAAPLVEAPAEDPVAQLKDQLLRLAADFDNFRKRARKEQDEVRKFGVATLLQDILPVIDNLDRALAHSEGDKSPVVQGVRMVTKQFADVLSRYNVTTFSSVGQPFDPERHEAVGQQASADKAPGTVVSELQKGYLIGDRLLRPARVVVATAPEAEAGDGQTASEARD